MPASERRKEIKRRRHRRKRLDQFKKTLDKATVTEKQEMAHKLRSLTPGAEHIIQTLSLEER